METATSKIEQITYSELQRKIEESKDAQTDQPFIAYYTAPWCQPCKTLYPMVAKLAEQLTGDFKVYQIDCEVHRDEVKAAGITSVPTMVLYNRGRSIMSLNGVNALSGASRMMGKADELSKPN